MATNPLLKNDNPYLRQTEWKARPSRTDPAWRYRPEGELLAAVDQWDLAEHHRREVDTNVAQLAVDGKKRADAEAKAAKTREDAIVETVFRDRYLSAGGNPTDFERDLPELRREHAKRVALGLDQPINSMAVLKEQLRAARAGRNLGAAPEPRPRS
jgi:hypothetical protein